MRFVTRANAVRAVLGIIVQLGLLTAAPAWADWPALGRSTLRGSRSNDTR
jgi:hypothetical protein